MCLLFTYFGRRNSPLLLEFSRLGRKFTAARSPRRCVCFVVREMASKQKRGVGGSVVAPYLFSAADYLLSARSRSRKGLFYYYSRRVFVFIWSRGRLFVFPPGERNLQRGSGGSGVRPNYLQGVNYVSVLQAKRAQPGTHVHARPTRGPQREVVKEKGAKLLLERQRRQLLNYALAPGVRKQKIYTLFQLDGAVVVDKRDDLQRAARTNSKFY
jgi:hypothetical protein